MNQWKKLSDGISYYSAPCLGDMSGKEPIMGLSINKINKNKMYSGIARQIISREGSPDRPGFVDRSKLIIVNSHDGINWKKDSDLVIKGINRIISKLQNENMSFIGLEDPDIITDNRGKKHLYFTIAFKRKNEDGFVTYLGHASGRSIYDLEASSPVLYPYKNFLVFKELAFSPVRKHKRFNLVEAGYYYKNRYCGVIASVESNGYGGRWKYGKIAVNPKNSGRTWIEGHASPCRIISEKTIRRKDSLLICIINGRERDKENRSGLIFGKFRPGLALFNPKTGKIPWIDNAPLFEDPMARTITFASDVLTLNSKELIVYCHVNDSFVRAYKICFEYLKKRTENIAFKYS